MRHVQRQFHATDSEMLEWASRWAIDNDWNVVLERFFPKYRAVACQPEELQAISRSIGDVRRVSVGPRKPMLGIAAAHKLVGANPDRLWMLLGALSDAGLREASVDGGTEDAQMLRTWRRLSEAPMPRCTPARKYMDQLVSAQPRQATVTRSAPIGSPNPA